VTWAVGERPAGGFEPADWRERGVEVVEGDDPGWLDDRLFHYDAVLARDGFTPESESAVARTQPQAPTIQLEQLEGPGDPLDVRLRSALAVAGIAPGAGVSRRR